ncbi:MAG: hypothetical protein KDJ34_04020 [Candidatus Competibacteraceae bacterium]|nr:hypothetical protein [Candidatus Competibacteraceae bacterium]
MANDIDYYWEESGYYWDNIPETVDPNDYIQRMVKADSKPGDARKRAYSNLRYAIKKGWIRYASTPHPKRHVLTESFYRWLLKKYQTIQGLPQHHIRSVAPGIPIPLGLGTPSCYSSEPLPLDPLVIQRLEQENRRLKEQNMILEEQLNKAHEEIRDLQERDAQRRRNCGRRTPTEKINS